MPGKGVKEVLYPYSPECVEGEFLELGLYQVLGSLLPLTKEVPKIVHIGEAAPSSSASRATSPLQYARPPILVFP